MRFVMVARHDWHEQILNQWRESLYPVEQHSPTNSHLLSDRQVTSAQNSALLAGASLNAVAQLWQYDLPNVSACLGEFLESGNRSLKAIVHAPQRACCAVSSILAELSVTNAKKTRQRACVRLLSGIGSPLIQGKD